MPNRDPPIADLRKSYELAELDESAALDDPLKQFEQWLAEAIAASVPEPNAMTLATVGSDLRPSTRIVLIKGLDARGPVWFTNYQSRKGVEMAGNPYAALQFHWAAKFGDNPPRPPHWGGYRLLPDNWQFWQGRRSRLHDRLRYTLQTDGGWLRERLAP